MPLVLFNFFAVNLVISKDFSSDRIEIVIIIIWIEIIVIVIFHREAFITKYWTLLRNARSNKGCTSKCHRKVCLSIKGTTTGV